MCVNSRITSRNCCCVSRQQLELYRAEERLPTAAFLFGSAFGSSDSDISVEDVVLPEAAVQPAAEKPPARQSLKSRIKSKLTPKASNFHYLLDFLSSYHSMMHSLNGQPAPYLNNSEIVAPVLIPGVNDDYMARVTMTRYIPPGYVVHYQRNYSPKRNKPSTSALIPESWSHKPQPGPTGSNLQKQ